VFGANGQIGFYSEYTHAEETVAITCRGATCGTINVAPAMSYITGNAMALDNLDTRRVDLRFFVYALRHRGMHDVISGSAQPQITRAPLLDITIPLPPLDEQKRIAAMLDQADELRRKRQRAIDRLNQLGQAIFYEMFGDPKLDESRWDSLTFPEACSDQTSGSSKMQRGDYLEVGRSIKGSRSSLAGAMTHQCFARQAVL
jgi:type I restriction enzyme S subunit